MKKLITSLLTLMLLTSCATSTSNKNFKEERDNYVTVLNKELTDGSQTVVPPEGVNLELVQYTSSVGELDAYISTNPNDGQKHPLVIWVTGGWSNSISDFLWKHNSWDNDQSGTFLREKGILVMYPSFRGGNTNPGFKETMYGEVDDIFSAYEYAKSLDYVDSNKIYLVGHSTGGTRALLASAYDDVFRGIFALGPVGNIKDHNQENFTFDISDNNEVMLRSPINWLHNINTPTFIIEGEKGNSSHLLGMEKIDNNDFTEYFVIEEAGHFDYIASTTILIADEILKDVSEESKIAITSEKLAEAYKSEPIILYPTLTTKKISNTDLNIDVPAYWYSDSGNDYNFFYDENFGKDNNFWSSIKLFTVFVEIREDDNVEEFYVEYLSKLEEEYYKENINGIEVYVYVTEDNNNYYKTVLFNDDDYLYELTFYYQGDEFYKANVLIELMFESIKLD